MVCTGLTIIVDSLTLLWSPYVIAHTIIFLPCDFYLFLLLLSSFFILCLISAAADWMSTILPHMVWPSVNLECKSEIWCMRPLRLGKE